MYSDFHGLSSKGETMSGDTIIYSDNEVIVRGEPLAGSIVWQGVSGP